MKTILSIIPYTLTSKDFFEVREPLKNRPNNHFFRCVPEWCVRDDNGHIDWTENYHQYSGFSKWDTSSKYFLFDINPIDLLLEEEISNVGVVELFKGYDWRPLFKKITTNPSPHNYIRIPLNVHVVVDLEYVGGNEDYELIVEVSGFLDDTMSLSRI